ncbi:MAG: peptidoglycan DD-metalloendopeptidase family protein [Desulfitobacteriaceae bacterium]|nr:peptidoglycan DD-metalloendopeptidase family protein [Desulfitobacteriaceae bacterium]MDD4751724.1 peptidoglycan DD-metalloendopeptidase family protein [Desulfitobacteriaceae bacterium]
MYTFTKEQLLQKRPHQRRISRSEKSKGKSTKRIISVIGLLLIILIIGVWLHKANTAYAIVVNGQEIALVESRVEGDNAVKEFLDLKSEEFGREVITPDSIEVEQVQVNGKDKMFGADISEALAEKITVLISGAVIVIDGEEKIIVSSKDAGEKLVKKVEDQFSNNKKDVSIIKSEVKEKVEVREKNVLPKNIVDEGKALQLLTVGTEKTVSHEVASGESLWSIAKDNNLKMEELIAANPSIDPDKLSIGDKINLVKAEPMMHVTCVYEYSEVKETPFETQVIRDDDMLRGKEKVKQEGKKGTKEFKYRAVAVNGSEVDKQFLAGTVITKPVPKIVERGSKTLVASRGSGGSGELAWPVSGQITSRFGYRGREYHTGLDIDGSTGDPIRAAEGGKVIFSGWSGGYGRMIKIDHGSGLQTWYAHLSSSKVSTGDKVTRGEVIGAVGSTGRSTGSHLHLEVRINGSAVNPLRYLN